MAFFSSILSYVAFKIREVSIPYRVHAMVEAFTYFPVGTPVQVIKFQFLIGFMQWFSVALLASLGLGYT